MLEILTSLLIIILIISLVAYFYAEAQRTRIKEEAKRAVFLRVTAMKGYFKADVNLLVEKQMLSRSGQEAIYRIANNFFVFQPITDETVDSCELLLKGVISAINDKLTGDAEDNNFDFVQEQVNLFVRALPATSSGYNANFYRNELPLLIKQLTEAEEESGEIDSCLTD